MSQELTISLTIPPASPEILAEKIAAAGAILTLAGCPVRRYLVGHVTWLDQRRLFWFTAHGDSAEDGHVLEFDAVESVTSQWICFHRDGKLVAGLSAIRTAGVDDPDDYLIAWQLWHEVAPRRTKLIGHCLAAILPAEDGDPVPESPRRASGTPWTSIKPDAC